MSIRVGLGQDSHRFVSGDTKKPCILAGIVFPDTPGLKAESDGDVVFHAICNAISSLSGVLILGDKADTLCHQRGITDSRVYLEEALKTLPNDELVHIAISLEGRRPHFKEHIPAMRQSIAEVCQVPVERVGITATSGEGLTEFGLGVGLQALALVTVQTKAVPSGTTT